MLTPKQMLNVQIDKIEEGYRASYTHNPCVAGIGNSIQLAIRNLRVVHITLGNTPDGRWNTFSGAITNEVGRSGTKV